MRRLRSFTLDGQIESGGTWVGSPDEIKQIIRGVISSIGYFEHASLQINFGTLDFRAAQKSMRLFAAEVMPHFADNAAYGQHPEHWTRASSISDSLAQPGRTHAATSDATHGVQCRRCNFNRVAQTRSMPSVLRLPRSRTSPTSRPTDGLSGRVTMPAIPTCPRPKHILGTTEQPSPTATTLLIAST